jgi:hypothetical protein
VSAQTLDPMDGVDPELLAAAPEAAPWAAPVEAAAG